MSNTLHLTTDLTENLTALKAKTIGVGVLTLSSGILVLSSVGLSNPATAILGAAGIGVVFLGILVALRYNKAEKAKRAAAPATEEIPVEVETA